MMEKQGTDEWRAARAGRLTASELGNVFSVVQERRIWLAADASGTVSKAAVKQAEIMDALKAARGQAIPANGFSDSALKALLEKGLIEVTTGPQTCQFREESAAAFIPRLMERYLGFEIPGGDYISAEMRRGTELEPIARIEYEMALAGESPEWSIIETGFRVHEELPFCGASPDGILVDGDNEEMATLELKCPGLGKHLQWRAAGALPAEHLLQVHGQMVATGLEEARFVSYCPCPPRWDSEIHGLWPRLFSVAVPRGAFTAELIAGMELFQALYRETAKKLLGIELEF